MWVLLGISNDTVENETFVYFIGVFDDLKLAKQQAKHVITSTNSKKNECIIKSVVMNTSYHYEWSNSDEDEVKF